MCFTPFSSFVPCKGFSTLLILYWLLVNVLLTYWWVASISWSLLWPNECFVSLMYSGTWVTMMWILLITVSLNCSCKTVKFLSNSLIICMAFGFSFFPQQAFLNFLRLSKVCRKGQNFNKPLLAKWKYNDTRSLFRVFDEPFMSN